MAAPNIVGVTSIYGRVAGQAVGITTTAIVTNSNASDKVLKINSLIASNICLLYTSPSPRDRQKSRMPSSA